MATANRPNDKRRITNSGRKSRSEGRVRIIASIVVKTGARVKTGLVNAHEGKAGVVLFAGKTV